MTIKMHFFQRETSWPGRWTGVSQSSVRAVRRKTKTIKGLLAGWVFSLFVVFFAAEEGEKGTSGFSAKEGGGEEGRAAILGGFLLP